ncbi:MAG: hypothetical protein U5P41_09785 [Gammaproteobacteria bacterium]|nr:hypothetical protein [Gammaproteobacteria bacterium]
MVDGGFVEVSGKQSLNFSGFVDTACTQSARRGTLLLDPATLTIIGGTGDGAAEWQVGGPGTDDDAADCVCLIDAPRHEVIRHLKSRHIEDQMADIVLQATNSINVDVNEFTYIASGNLVGEASGRLAAVASGGVSLTIRERVMPILIGETGSSDLPATGGFDRQRSSCCS